MIAGPLSTSSSWSTASTALLVVVLVHGFNGVRVILQEIRQTKPWTQFVDAGTIVAIIVTVAYGTRTVVLAVFGAG